MKPSAFELHIETLVLEGTTLGNPQAIRAAIESELARLFVERGIPASLAGPRTLDRVQAGSFAVGQPDGPGRTEPAVGRHVAAAIYRGVGR